MATHMDEIYVLKDPCGINNRRFKKCTIYYCPKTLQKLCGIVVSKHTELERELFAASPYGVDYKYNFEKCVEEIQHTLLFRYITRNQSFERWFRKLVTEKMDLIMENKEDLKFMIKTAESLEKILLKFKKLYGIALEVFSQNEYLLLRLRRLL